MAKSGELRVLKNGVVYGPFDRAVMEQMIDSGRIDRSDQVSVRGAPWMSIADFLSTPSATSTAPPPPAAPMPGTGVPSTAVPSTVAPRKHGSLRVLRGNRMVGSLDRGQVEQLYADGRLGDDDLICATGGPWMLVGDFLAAPRPRPATGTAPAAAGQIAPPLISQPLHKSRAQPANAQPPVSQPPVSQPPVSQPPIARPLTAQAPIARPVYAQPPAGEPPLEGLPIVQPVYRRPPVAEPVYDQRPLDEPPIEAPAYEEPEWVAPEDAAVETAIRRDLFADFDQPVLQDEWYVRVRGIHSAPLKKQHVRRLIESREVTLDDAARHCSWRETDWRSIRSIPELAGIAG